ncbi:hypothetical protein L1987_58080 [Smallanthus sonchifolius]|uniref:Uncharacterized protein n=1 Tax=Smallanthus sonchifolius TaxID=185202 RepID=A0ACB9DET4_9ASTR|nr:hypothetical protein L1987_58080 [Smallanthus sonchifolius]
MLFSIDGKKNFEELLKVPCSGNGEAPNEDNEKVDITDEYHTLFEVPKEHTRLLNAILDHRILFANVKKEEKGHEEGKGMKKVIVIH